MTTVENEHNVSVQWSYDGVCAADEFHLATYLTNGTMIGTAITVSALHATVNELPMCVPLFVGIWARNDAGDSVQGNSSEFTIYASK